MRLLKLVLKQLKLNRIAGAVSVGVMSGLALTAIMVSKFALHSQVVILNIYTNGSADWSVDATMFLKSLYVLMFVFFTIGLALGLIVTQRDWEAITAHECRKTSIRRSFIPIGQMAKVDRRD